jgi:hypothetical protein
VTGCASQARVSDAEFGLGKATRDAHGERYTIVEHPKLIAPGDPPGTGTAPGTTRALTPAQGTDDDFVTVQGRKTVWDDPVGFAPRSEDVAAAKEAAEAEATGDPFQHYEQQPKQHEQAPEHHEHEPTAPAHDTPAPTTLPPAHAPIYEEGAVYP